MEVYITVDTECVEERVVGGRVRPPIGYNLMMRGRFENQADGWGTDFICRELAPYGFHATFFMETLCATYFGINGLREVCEELRRHGHDLQLHLHPNFRRPEWRRSGESPMPDNIGDYELEEQRVLLQEGLSLLIRAGVPQSSVVAFRAGNYGASNDTWQAVRDVGLSIDSSFNLWAVGRDCRIQEDVPRNDLYEAIPGVWELPISCFREGSRYRHLEVSAISSAEMRYTLKQLAAVGTRAATVIMHPGEFFVVDNYVRRTGRPNRINIARLRNLLRFLDSSRDRFHVQTVGKLGAQLRLSPPSTRTPSASVPRGSIGRRFTRLPAQLMKRIAMRPRT